MENNYELIGEDKHKSPIYFVPDIEDIRVGYECEIKPTGSEELDWMPYVINGDTAFKYYKTKGKGATSIRVPYLTKEQIEAEGWVFDKIYLGDVYYKRLGYSMCHFLSQKRISITRESSDTKWYMGECKDINTFRYICKLLNIK